MDSKKRTRKINRMKRQKERSYASVQKTRTKMEAYGDFSLSSLSMKKNDDLHSQREEEDEVYEIYLFQVKQKELYDAYISQQVSENNDEYYNPIQTFSTKKIYEECSFGTGCACEDYCKKQSFFTTDSTGEESLAPRLDGKCYCGRKRENCPNYITYGTDCQGFGRVRFKGDYSSDEEEYNQYVDQYVGDDSDDYDDYDGW